MCSIAHRLHESQIHLRWQVALLHCLVFLHVLNVLKELGEFLFGDERSKFWRKGEEEGEEGKGKGKSKVRRARGRGRGRGEEGKGKG